MIERAFTLMLLLIFRVYQKLVSPLFPSMCRFHPSCSSYAIEAVEILGPLLGTWRALKRLCKCHPFNAGGYDPVKE